MYFFVQFQIQIFHKVSKRIRKAPIELMKEEQKYAKSNTTPTDFDIFWWDKRNELPMLSKTLLNLTTIPSSTFSYFGAKSSVTHAPQ